MTVGALKPSENPSWSSSVAKRVGLGLAQLDSPLGQPVEPRSLWLGDTHCPALPDGDRDFRDGRPRRADGFGGGFQSPTLRRCRPRNDHPSDVAYDGVRAAAGLRSSASFRSLRVPGCGSGGRTLQGANQIASGRGQLREGSPTPCPSIPGLPEADPSCCGSAPDPARHAHAWDVARCP